MAAKLSAPIWSLLVTAAREIKAAKGIFEHGLSGNRFSHQKDLQGLRHGQVQILATLNSLDH
jgi:hypothetical protein